MVGGFLKKFNKEKTKADQYGVGRVPALVQRKATFATLTINDLPKLEKTVPYISKPIESTATKNGISVVTEPTISVTDTDLNSDAPQRSMALHDGAGRDVCMGAVATPIDGRAESCAASIVSPGGRGLSPVTPMSDSGHDISPIMSRRPPKHAAQLPTIVDENDYEENPFADANSMRIFPTPAQTPRMPIPREAPVPEEELPQQQQYNNLTVANETPRLRTLYTSFWPGQYTSALSPYNKSPTPVSAVSRTTSRWNPFASSPQEQYQQPQQPQQSDYIPSRKQPSPSEYSLRYSDCGRNPFDGLDEEAIRERDSSGIGRLWQSILGRKKSEQNLSQSAAAPALSRNVAGKSMLTDNIIDHYSQPHEEDLPPPPSRKHDSNVLVDYDGRPSTRNLMVHHPQANEPYQIQSPSEGYEDVSKQHILRLEAEIAELKRWKEVQQDRETNKEIIQRQLESERRLDALRQAMEAEEAAKRLRQMEPSPVSPEAYKGVDRRSTNTVATEWPNGFDTPIATSSQHDFPPSLRELRDCYLQESQNNSGSNNNNVRQAEVPDRRSFPNESKARGLFIQRPHEAASPIAGPSHSNAREAEEPATPQTPFLKNAEHVTSREPGHRQSELPPPYSKTPNKFIGWRKSRGSRGQQAGHARNMSQADSEVYPGTPDLYVEDSKQNAQAGDSRYPVKPSHLPKLTITTDGESLHMPPKQLTQPFTSPQMKFTPTTPHLSRSQTHPHRHFGAAQAVTLTSVGIGRLPHELRDEAEKKRVKQEKREKRMGRGGWCWLCGLCCGVRKMSKKQKWCWAIFLLVVVIVAIVGGVLHSVKNKMKHAQELKAHQKPQFVTLANFPPLPVGNLTITPRTVNKVDTCVTPPTLWSCSLPPPVGSGQSQDMPIFHWIITAQNGTNIPSGQTPAPPGIVDYKNASSLDGITVAPFEGEETGFFASMNIDSVTAHSLTDSTSLFKRAHPRDILLNRRQSASNSTGSFPGFSVGIAQPSATGSSFDDTVASSSFASFAPTQTEEPSTTTAAFDIVTSAIPTQTGSSVAAVNTVSSFLSIPTDTAVPASPSQSPAELFPAYIAQPLRFFNRGTADEHFGFMTYFSKTIYVRSIDATGPSGQNPLDAVGGVTPAEARWVCKYPETRYLVKIYTNSNSTVASGSNGKVKVVVDPASLAVDTSEFAGGMGGYPVTIEEDRAGVVPKYPKSTVRCWPIDDRGNVDPTGSKIVPEYLGVGTAGSLTNPALPGTQANPGKGCQCQWTNWKSMNPSDLSLGS